MANTTPTEQRLSLDALYQAYRRERLPSEATQKHYRFLIDLFRRDLALVGGDSSNLHVLSRDQILSWREAIIARASPRTWNNYSAHMRALWRYEIEFNLLVDNPWKKTQVKVPKPFKKTVPDDVLGQALRALKNYDRLKPGWFWAITLKTLYYTGIRRRQLVGLTLSDVDLDQMTLHLSEKHAKNGIERSLPISMYLERDLRDLLNRHRMLGSQPTDQLFNVTVFNDRYKGPTMTVWQVSGFFRRLSGVLDHKVSAHRFRHTFGTQLAKNEDLKTVQELLGHTDINSTLEYIHPDMEQHRQALTTLKPL